MPLSNDPEKRARQLANLRRGGATAGKFVVGNTAAVTHGGRVTEATIDPILLNDRERRIVAAMQESAPHLATPAFGPAVRAVAVLSMQVDYLRAHLAKYGHRDERGGWRPENQLLDAKLATYMRALAELGLTPASAARLGLDQARTLDLAQRWSDEDDLADGEVVDGG